MQQAYYIQVKNQEHQFSLRQPHKKTRKVLKNTNNLTCKQTLNI